MPFVSKAQERWAFRNKMPWADKWAKMTKGKKLPMHVAQKKAIRSKRSKRA